MSGRCRSTLAPLADVGFSAVGLRRLIGSRRQLPARLGFTRAEVIHHRATVAQRMSISGVQDKVSLRLVDGDLVPTDVDGEYLLKPIPGGPLPRFTGQAPANEHVTMQIAEQVFGIPAAANALVELADGEPAYLCRRFDRRDGRRIDVEDFASLAGQSPDSHGRNFKYTGSYQQLGALLRRHCPAYAIEAEKLFALIVFSYAFGNGDAHLKNFSVLASADGDPVLTPAYDLLCTSLHLPDESRLALDLFADDYETPTFTTNGFAGSADFRELARRFGLRPARSRRIVAAFTDRALAARADDLVRRSFLDRDAQDAYLAIVDDRRRALRGR